VTGLRGSNLPKKVKNLAYNAVMILLVAFVLDTGILGGTNAQTLIQNYEDNLELVTNLAQEEHGTRPKFVKVEEGLSAYSDEYITEHLRRKL
jgi:hypothetical protein